WWTGGNRGSLHVGGWLYRWCAGGHPHREDYSRGANSVGYAGARDRQIQGGVCLVCTPSRAWGAHQRDRGQTGTTRKKQEFTTERAEGTEKERKVAIHAAEGNCCRRAHAK